MLREAESILLERPIRKASLTPKQLGVFGGKFQQHMDAKLGQPFGMTPITPGGKESSRKRDEKMNPLERRLAYVRESEAVINQRGIESNAKAERREAEAQANADRIEREAQARVAELERQADAAAAKRDQAVKADIEAIVNQSVRTKVRPRARIRFLERKVAELEGEIERLKDANEQEAEEHRRELVDVRLRLTHAEQDAEKYHRRARMYEIERETEAQRPKPLPPPPTPPTTIEEIGAKLQERAAKRKIEAPLAAKHFGPAGDIHGIEAD